MFNSGWKTVTYSFNSTCAEFFDYNAKYDDTSTVEEVIELPAEINERVNKASLACYKALKCSVYARVDMMVKDGIPYVMEINTLPGMTQSSLLPKVQKRRELVIANY